ncbi:hypothetical protein lbkm_3277 [Lachnospiraceae bacterium KM106-2]|nr:hypothetical protein lbkm_3277 [Lachnospiraceae bacterium KM106-2]
MVEMYVRLILKGKRFFAEVPENIKEEVKEELLKLDREDLLDV